MRLAILIVLMSLIVVFLTACSEKGLPQLKASNQQVNSSESVWERHNELPQFTPEIHSDGCSGGMSAIYEKLTLLHEKHGKTLEWRKCCILHDKAYYYGGTKIEKNLADDELATCVSQVVGGKYLAKAMKIAVQIGGGPNLPTPYRWGYGVDYITK